MSETVTTFLLSFKNTDEPTPENFYLKIWQPCGKILVEPWEPEHKNVSQNNRENNLKYLFVFHLCEQQRILKIIKYS